MTVKIEMEMPKSCRECPFYISITTKYFGYATRFCACASKEIRYASLHNKRKKFCPLKPVKGE